MYAPYFVQFKLVGTPKNINVLNEYDFLYNFTKFHKKF